MSLHRLIFLALLGSCTGAALSAQTGGYWPQYRGPERTNVAKDSGLLQEWPKEGPPLIWKVAGLGSGYAPVSIAEGRIYTLAHRDGKEYAVALDRGTGKEVWASLLGTAREEGVMQFLFQRQPVIDGDRLYAFSRNAVLFCLDADGGQVRWRKDYRVDFQGRTSSFGWNDNPLIDGDRLICTPGGKEAMVAALNKHTGAVVWKATVPDGSMPSHVPVVAADLGGVRQYLVMLSGGLFGVAAQDGKILWRYDRTANQTANAAPPIVRDDRVFTTGGYGKGSALLQVASPDGMMKVDEIYFSRDMQNLNGGIVLVGDHVFGSYTGFYGQLMCLDWKTGKTTWKEKKGGCSGVIAADGLLICRHQNGLVTLAEASPQAYREKGSFMQPERSQQPACTFPVLAGGRLYLRDQEVLLCYDLRADRPAVPPAPEKLPVEKQSRLPDAVFIPSPQDVVEKMLELAKVKKEDVVVDLGCGDGRIPVTAAKKYGCKAVGYDLDEECIKLALARVKDNKVEDLVRIVHEDVFKVDLSNADVVTLFLLPQLNVKLIPQLEKMKPGGRIVSHAFDMKGVMPDKVVTYTSKEDDVERKLYLWTLPLKRE